LSEAAIVEVPQGRRTALQGVLEESFEGWYLRHSLSTLSEIEEVRAATVSGEYAGLAMLKMLEPGLGYVFYIAVARKFRRAGIGGRLLDDSLGYLRARGSSRVFASVEEDNEGSRALFASRGFVRTQFGDMSREFGIPRAINLYRKMRVVPGERLLSLVPRPAPRAD
jgi:ribosomal protein S18 acetylase RimI-like enzyme